MFAKGILCALALVAAATPASAQRSEVALLGGYTGPGEIAMKAPGIQDLEAGGGLTWGVEVTRFFSDHVALSISWAQQHGALALATRGGEADLFDMTVGLLHGGVVYRFRSPEAELQPFLRAGLGASFLGAPDLDAETKFSLGLGAGIGWFPSRRVGARMQARYAPTVLGDSSSDVCDPFGFCQGTLHQFELMGGLVFRF